MDLRFARLALAAACLVLAVAGCGGGDDSEDAASGTGYSVSLPEGWREATDELSTGAINFDLVVAGEREGGFLTNVNVIREDPPGVPDDVDALVESYAQQLEKIGETRPRPLPERQIDGEPARGNTVEVLAQEVRYSVVQYFAIHNDAVYTVTLSSDESALPGARSDFDELLDSWRWD